MKEGPSISVWDLWIRTFHWSLALSVVFMLGTGWFGLEGSQLFQCYHSPVGQFVGALVVFRLLWGLFGSTNARLSTLVRNPVNAVTHIKRLLLGNGLQQERGHNAAGSWAVLIMLLLLSFQAFSGYFIADTNNGDVFGPFYYTYSLERDLPSFIPGLSRGMLSDMLLDLHYLNADLLLAIVVIHVAMIFLYMLLAKQNLITPMVSGKMNWKSSHSPSTYVAGSNVAAVITLALVLLLFGWVGEWHTFITEGAGFSCMAGEGEFDF